MLPDVHSALTWLQSYRQLMMNHTCCTVHSVLSLGMHSNSLFVMESLFAFEIGSICQLCHCVHHLWHYSHDIGYVCDIMMAAGIASCCHSNDSSKWLVFYLLNNIVITLLILKQNIFNDGKGSTLKMLQSVHHDWWGLSVN